MGETYRIYGSPREMSESMPCELAWSEPEQIGRQNLWVFRSKNSDELKRLLSVLSITETCRGNGPIKDKIKYCLQRVNAGTGSYLIQFWAPVTIGSSLYLTTADQPFALAELVEGLGSYRKHCLDYLIPVDNTNTEEAQLSPPGRVFLNGLPEVNFDVRHYSTREFPLRDHAVSFGVYNYLALPLFEPPGCNCIGVLELVDVSRPGFERLFYKYFVKHFMEILKEVDLQSSEIYHNLAMHTSRGPQRAFNEIRKALEVVCRTHQLLLAQTWVPISDSGYTSKVRTADKGSYFLHRNGYDFAEACSICCIQKGQGIVGRALASQGACFCKDISQLSITEYSLVSCARKAGLTGCFAICLRYIGSGDYVYIVELFLSLSEIGSSGIMILVEMLLATLKQHLLSFKVASGQELGEQLLVEVIKTSSADEFDSFEVCHLTGTRYIPNTAELQYGGKVVQLDDAILNAVNVDVLVGGAVVLGMTPGAVSSYPPVESRVSMPMQFDESSYDNNGLARKINEGGKETLSAAPVSMEPNADKTIDGRTLDHEAGCNVLATANKLNQSAFQIAPQIIGLRQPDSSPQHEGMLIHPPTPSQIIHVQQEISSGSRIHLVEWNNSAVALESLPTEDSVQAERYVASRSPPWIGSPITGFWENFWEPEAFQAERHVGGRSSPMIGSPFRGLWEQDTLPEERNSGERSSPMIEFAIIELQDQDNLQAERDAGVKSSRTESPVRGLCEPDISQPENTIGGRSPSRVESTIRGMVLPDSSSQQPITVSNDLNKTNQASSGQDDSCSSRKKGVVTTLDIEYGIDRCILLQYSHKKLKDVADILQVSRSTLKRICRKHDILRWPPYKAKKLKCTAQEPVQDIERNVEDWRIQYQSFSKQLHLKQDSSCKARALLDGRSVLDGSSMMVKASYTDGTIIKFELSLSAKKSNLEEKVAKRLNLSVGSFSVEYLDEENEWILVACDEDLRTCLNTLRSLGNTSIRMRIA